MAAKKPTIVFGCYHGWLQSGEMLNLFRDHLERIGKQDAFNLETLGITEIKEYAHIDRNAQIFIPEQFSIYSKTPMQKIARAIITKAGFKPTNIHFVKWDDKLHPATWSREILSMAQARRKAAQRRTPIGIQRIKRARR